MTGRQTIPPKDRGPDRLVATNKAEAKVDMEKRSRMIPGNSKKSRVWQKTNGHCHLCSQKLKRDDWRIDHLVPRDDGGPDDEWNLLPSCIFCNGMKKAAETYRMRRFLMYGRYCLEEATKRENSDIGKMIYEFVGQRVRTTAQRAKSKPGHVQLWKQTPKKFRK